MKNLYVFLSTLLLVISTWAIAEEVELLDTYLEEVPSGTSSHQLDSGAILGQPEEVVVDDNGQEYRRVETADGSELYEAVPAHSATDHQLYEDIPVHSATETVVYEEVPVHSATPVTVTNTDVLVTHEAQVQSHEDLEIIELEPEQSDYVVIEAPEHQTSQTVATTGSNTQRRAVSGHAFCQQNPYARECLLSKYLSLCKKDPQSSDCKSELYKFDKFCSTFPRAYKCKKANIAATCKQNPGTAECQSFGQRYCQKYPKAIFCNYN